MMKINQEMNRTFCKLTTSDLLKTITMLQPLHLQNLRISRKFQSILWWNLSLLGNTLTYIEMMIKKTLFQLIIFLITLKKPVSILIQPIFQVLKTSKAKVFPLN